MVKWKRKFCAFILAPQLRHTRHVLNANLFDACASPFPFGLGVYTRKLINNQPMKGDLLPMLYVSHEVARDRAPGQHDLNVPGVQEGWYVVAEPDTEFEIHISSLNDLWTENNYNHSGNPSLPPPPRTMTRKQKSRCRSTLYDYDNDDEYDEYDAQNRIRMVRGELFVDGRNTYNYLDINENTQHLETIARGFILNQNPMTDSKIRRHFRLFSFIKAPITDDEHDQDLNPRSGKIELKVFKGWCSRRPVPTRQAWNERYNDGGKVCETVAEKQGKSLQVGVPAITECVVECRHATASNVALIDPWRDANLVVHIREYSWMRSRRLMTDNGHPCTYEQFLELLECDLQQQQQQQQRKQQSEENSHLQPHKHSTPLITPVTPSSNLSQVQGTNEADMHKQWREGTQKKRKPRHSDPNMKPISQLLSEQRKRRRELKKKQRTDRGTDNSENHDVDDILAVSLNNTNNSNDNSYRILNADGSSEDDVVRAAEVESCRLRGAGEVTDGLSPIERPCGGDTSQRQSSDDVLLAFSSIDVQNGGDNSRQQGTNNLKNVPSPINELIDLT